MLTATAVGFALILTTTVSSAQTAEKPAPDDPERQHAQELYDRGNFVAAMPLFEKLSAEHPTDNLLKGRWAWCIFGYSATLTDIELQKKARVRARTVALQAKEMGNTDQLLQVLLDLPEDGGLAGKFSDRKDVDTIMKAAEANFARGEFDKARDGYMQASLLDPKNYDAPLLIGDVYFNQHVYGSAGAWFERATQLDPNRETAFRYWGDALAALEKDDDARSKYIDAIVAEPYTRLSWTGLQKWLKRNKLELNNIQLKNGAAVTQKDDKNTTITLDPSSFGGKHDPNGPAWMTYGIGVASWHGDKFKKEFPNEPKYRRTLKEEADALGLMVTVIKEQKDYKKHFKDLDPGLQALIKIQELGFLEPFVLLNRADGDIAKDYEPYRAANRENIRRYLNDFVVPKGSAQTGN
jgi:tetratricopeptide (TPR) repeat protein